MKITLCVDKQNRGSPSEELREYIIDIGCPLRSIDDVFDELKISTDDNNILVGQITRRCYVDKYGVLKKLEQEKIQELDIPKIELFEGTNYVYIKEFTNLNMKLEYLTNAEMNKYFATRMEMNSSIKQTADSINLKVSKKVGKDEIISKINMSPEEIQILANKLGLTANDVINIIAGSEINLTSMNISLVSDNWSISAMGYMDVQAGEIGNFTLSNGKLTSPITVEYDYTENDINKLRSYLMGETQLTDEEKVRLDANKDGILNSADIVTMRQYVNSGITTRSPGKFEIDTQPEKLNILNFYDGSGGLRYYIGYWSNKLKLLQVEELTINGANPITSNETINKMQYITNEAGTPNYIEVLSNAYPAYGVDIWQSDKRLKDNIQDSLYKALDKVMKIKHRSFDYKNGGHVALGYVADELQEIDSDFVVEVGEDKMKQPLPRALIPLLSKAIQEQQEIIEKLESRVDELEKKVNVNE